jgi:hypothetical protein
MRFALGTLTRLAMLSGLVLTGACGDDPVQPPPTENPAPTGLAATATGASTINVTWTAPTTAVTQFVLQRATGAAAYTEIARPSASATSYADAGLTANTGYSYRLAAVRDGETSDYSTVATATTDEDEVPSNIVLVTSNITTNTNWTADKVYVLVGFIKVANGATLTIQAGTRIAGDFETLGSSLFVLRGARIIANGTAQAPIVFTSEREAGQRQPGDWGGLILIGNARINRSGTVNLEGTGTDNVINPFVPYSGGDNDFDNSGTLRYVRVEYAGYAPAQDAELNSFTFAAVGGQTTAEFLQALNGLDDHFEFFGGNMDLRNLVSYEAGDDHFDMSEGFRGRLQYLIGFQSKVLIPRPQAGGVSTDPQGIENDGCGSNAGGGCDLGFNSTPLTIPVVANFTLVGTGPGVVGAGGGYGMVLRRGVGGHYVNGLLARWPSAGIGYRDAQTKLRENEGVFSLQGIYVAETTTLFQAGQQTYASPDNLEHSPATTAASLFTTLATNPASPADLDWSLAAAVTPRTGGVAVFTGDLANRAAGFINGTVYRGAADPAGTKWWAGWTEYSDN